MPNFPNNPTDGQYFETGQRLYKYNSDAQTWDVIPALNDAVSLSVESIGTGAAVYKVTESLTAKLRSIIPHPNTPALSVDVSDSGDELRISIGDATSEHSGLMSPTQKAAIDQIVDITDLVTQTAELRDETEQFTETASDHKDAAQTAAGDAAASAAAAGTQAAAANDVLVAIQAIAGEITNYDEATIITHADSPHTLTLAEIAKGEIRCDDTDGDVTILYEKDTYKDNDHPLRSVSVLIHKATNSANKVLVGVAGGEVAEVAPTVLYTGTPYVARDADGVADTDDTNHMYAAALPTVHITAPAGDNRILYAFVGAGWFATSFSGGDPSLTATVDGNTATVIRGFPSPAIPWSGGDLGIIGYPIGSSATPTNHDIIVSVNKALGRASQFIVPVVVQDGNQSTIYEAVANNQPNDGGAAITGGFSNALPVDGLGTNRLYLACLAWFKGYATLPVVGVGTSLAAANTGGTIGRDITFAVLSADGSLGAEVDFETHVPTASNNDLIGGVGFAVPPVPTVASEVDLKTENEGSPQITIPYGHAILRCFADGTTIRLAGVS